jgi:aminoglycoside phosphotransferase (APT) family kinase protein
MTMGEPETAASQMDGERHDPPGLDLRALQAYFDEHVAECRGPLQADIVAGGRSNLTYRITDGTTEWALRRPPMGGLTPSAHDVGREYRVMAALRDSGIAVPLTVSLCTDPAVIGAPFTVVSWVEGTVLRSRDDLRGVPLAQLAACAKAMVAQLARLHTLSYADFGLGEFGRPQGYLHRQLSRWRRQWDLIAADAPAALDRLYRQLEAGLRPESGAAIVHGDYRLDNLIFAAGDLADVRAVVDWELSTLGDPLADVGILLAYCDPAVDPLLGHPASTAPDFPSAGQLARDYEQLSGRDLTDLSYYLAFAYFKIAVISQGVHSRYLHGVTVGDGFSEAGRSVPLLLEAGLRALSSSGPELLLGS